MLHRLCKNLGSAWGKNNPSVAISQLLPWGICRESTDLGRKEAAKYVLWGPHGVALRHFLRNEVPAPGLVPVMAGPIMPSNSASGTGAHITVFVPKRYPKRYP